MSRPQNLKKSPNCFDVYSVKSKQARDLTGRFIAIQGLLYLDGRNSQKYLHQDQADF